MTVSSIGPSRPRIAALACVLALLAGVAFLVVERPGRRPAPDLGFTRLDGRPARIADFRGKVLLVNFWATSCAPCLHEMPALAEVQQRYRARGFETIGVAMQYDPPASVIDYAQTRRLPFEIAIDHDGAIAQGFGAVELTPTTFLIDRQGRIVERWLGQADIAALRDRVERLLADS